MNQERAGVIPYIIDNGTIWFCFGRDRQTRELTDFAGRVNKEDQNIEDTALRECREETLDIFKITKETLEQEDPIYIYDDRSLTILVPVNKLSTHGELYRKNSIKNFKQELRRWKKAEVIGLKWISSIDLITMISLHDPKMYIRTRCLIRDISKIIPMLRDFSFSEASPATIEFVFERNLMASCSV
jgi:8-oxo-dGTP pyrophosphatase MutT (NUDIX family)